MNDPAHPSYNVIMFAHNEAGSIASTLTQAFEQTDEKLHRFIVLANGCTDNTHKIVVDTIEALGDKRLQLITLQVADKCNAWNHYVHELAKNTDCHFCIDADVLFSKNCFPRLAKHLAGQYSDSKTLGKPNVIAGMPLSGRNMDFYQSLVTERQCFFGNLYGMHHDYIEMMRCQRFKLPTGLNWIDSFLTKAANTDLQFTPQNLPNRVVYTKDVGFYTQSLSPFKWDDIQLYKNRIARYELGKLQELHLDRIPAKDWPEDMSSINKAILANFAVESQSLSALKRMLVKRRLQRLLTRQ